MVGVVKAQFEGVGAAAAGEANSESERNGEQDTTCALRPSTPYSWRAEQLARRCVVEE